jgi:hypothetical protein
MYTVEQYKLGYNEWWELVHAGNSKEAALEVATEKSREYHNGKARVSTWENGVVVDTEIIYEG